ncbi:MAG: zf-TFIIB domain-containing protein [Phycisphaerales bacterium]|nr:MAG: zf-TFIIB domain-containing protein [Phycisphaerales bacterium]
MNNLMCPACKTPLSPRRVAAGPLWRCEGCWGIAVNLAVLRRYLPSDIVKKLWRTAVTESMPAEKPCPSCGQALREFATSGEGRRVCLDLCKTCQLMWFDKHELALFPRATKAAPGETESKLALAKVQFEADLQDSKRPAASLVGQAADIIFLIIRLLL